MTSPIRLGISSCLLGERVRYDGDHKRDAYISETLARYVELVPVCPEVAIGLGVPRPPIQLIGDATAPRAVGVADPTRDVTAQLAAYGKCQARALTDISGYIFKSRSPSCGLAYVNVYGRPGVRPKSGRGVYAAMFTAAQPLLPVVDEDELRDLAVRDNFIERVFAFHRWQVLAAAAAVTPARLVEFHTAHKLMLMAHGAAHYTALGRMVANAGRTGRRALAAAYRARFMAALAQPPTHRRHANVLMYLLGYLKKRLDAADKAELLDLIEAYRLERLARIAPIALLRHHFRHHPDPWVARQVYLYPDAREFALRYGP